MTVRYYGSGSTPKLPGYDFHVDALMILLQNIILSVTNYKLLLFTLLAQFPIYRSLVIYTQKYVQRV